MSCSVPDMYFQLVRLFDYVQFMLPQEVLVGGEGDSQVFAFLGVSYRAVLECETEIISILANECHP